MRCKSDQATMGRRRGSAKASTNTDIAPAQGEATPPQAEPSPSPAAAVAPLARRSSSRRGRNKKPTDLAAKEPSIQDTAESTASKTDRQKPPHKSTNGGGKRSAWADPTPAQIEHQIHDSGIPVQIDVVFHDADDQHQPFHVAIVQCGVNNWQELVQLERLVETLQRPTKRVEATGKDIEDTIECTRSNRSHGPPRWQLLPSAVDATHRFDTSLKLRVLSLGLPAKSLLGEHIVLASPSCDDGTQKTKRRLVIDSVVVSTIAHDSQPPSQLQQFALPPCREVMDPLTHLHNPQLIPMVNDMLTDNKATSRLHVVILRGVPGSGKSSLGRDIIAIARARGARTVVCSGDSWFEAPRGYHFDSKKLTTAHDAAKDKFQAAVKTKFAPIVIVDNTNTQRWEYEGYEQLAAQQGCHVHLLELRCPDILTCHRMAQRNSHGVGAAKVLAMFLRWQPDARATVFMPRFHDPLVLPNPVTRNPANNYVAYVGLFLDTAARSQLLERITPTHRNVIAEHVTLFYRPTSQYIRQVPIGKRYKIRVTHTVEDAKGQALQVDVGDALHLKGANKVNHITVSTADGVSACYSNDLLEDPSVARTPVEDLELEVTLGVALMGQANKIITWTSPFHHEFDLTITSEVPPSPATDLTIIHLHEEDLQVGENASLEKALLRWAMLRHQLGPSSSSQRVIAVNRATQESQLTELQVLTALGNRINSVTGDSSTWVDRILLLGNDEQLMDRLRTEQLVSESLKRIHVLTTRCHAIDQHAFKSISVPVSIKYLPIGQSVGCPMSPLQPELDADLSKTLDLLGLSPTEQVCHAVHVAIALAEHALVVSGIRSPGLKRTDSVSWSQPAPVIDIACTGDVSIDDVTSIERGLRARGVTNILVDDEGEGDAVVYFTLPTRAAILPIVRLFMPKTVESPSRVRAMLIEQTVRSSRDALSLEEQDVFPRIAGLVGALLRASLKGCMNPADLQVLGERLVLAFIHEHPIDSLRTESKVAINPSALWAKINECINWAAALPIERVQSDLEAVAPKTLGSSIIAQRVIETMRRAHAAMTQHSSDTREPPEYGRWIIAALNQSMSPANDLHTRVVELGYEASSHLASLRCCDRATKLAQSSELNPGGDLFFCEPLGVVPGHVRALASSSELLDSITAKVFV